MPMNCLSVIGSSNSLQTSISSSYIAVLDIGHGNCTVIFERGDACIVDCGPGSFVLEFLIAEGISYIENIFLSHADQDHIEGLVALLASDQIQIGHVFVNSDGIKGSELWDDVLYTASKSSVAGGTKLHVAITRTEGTFTCGDLEMEIIGPSAYLAGKSPGSRDKKDRRITSNSISASFKLVWKNNSVVYLAGDIDDIALDDLVDHGTDIHAPVIVYPHHGGNTGADNVSFTEKLCELTGCKTVIFSIGRNKHLNPRQEVIAAIRKKVPDVRIACTQMSKHCAPTLSTISPTHMNAAFARGRNLNECCGGTFLIRLGDTVTYSPDINLHRAFITAGASSPICLK